MSSFESSALGLWGGESEDIIKRDFPIHRACRDGDIDALRRAWAVTSHDQLRAEDKFYGWTPIHWAAYFGKTQCLDVLLAFGVGANLSTTKFKQTPCHIASFGGHPKCLVKLLRSGANFHAQDYLGETPIHKAARVGNIEAIGVLLTNGSRVNLCNNNGHTPCDLARMQGFQECVRLLESSALQEVSRNNKHGASGLIVHRLNGNINNGRHPPDVNGNMRPRKRMLDDESIPTYKRSRIEFPNGYHNGILANSNDINMEMEDESTMPVENSLDNNSIVHDNNPNQCRRAPSPGMDIQLQEMDMQLWCHQNGYGDTAETMPSPDKSSCFKHRQSFSKNGQRLENSPVCARGIQARGWHWN
uniref:ankyrin repeat domain-containing protein 10-like n=1 Tax=Styela clava TaxID=7725 RepID=UPI00193AB068|nr:ankyrin repeat domain-containing protein 10-like [Styela clava]